MLSVSCLGTCRIQNPIAKLAKNKLVRLNNGNVQNYLHSTDEILQQISFLKENWLPPKSMWSLIFGEYFSCSKTVLYDLYDTDIFLVEISSKKVYRYNNYIVKPYIAESIIDKFNGENDRTFSSRFDNDREIINNFMKYYSFERQTLNKIKRGMSTIASTLPGKVVFVTHINATTSTGEILPGRKQLIDLVEEYGKELGLETFNPTTLVEKYGQSFALRKKGQDLNHYNSLFFQIIGCHIFENYL